MGEENAFIFGLSADEVINFEKNGGYDPELLFQHRSGIRQVLMSLITGTFSNDTEMFRDIYDSLLNTNSSDRADTYFILAGLQRAVHRHREGGKAAYRDEGKMGPDGY